VRSEAEDTRVRMKVSAADRQGELYFRVRPNGPNYKFLELRDPVVEDGNTEETPKPIQTNFLGIEGITVDRATGSWTKIVLSLHHAEFPRKSGRRERPAAGGDVQATDGAAPAGDSLPRQRPRGNRSRGGGGGRRRGPRRGGGGGDGAATKVATPS